MGGIIIAITMIILSAIMYKTNNELLPLSIIITGYGLVGFVDDFKKLILKDTEGLKPVYKILGLLGVSVICAMYLIRSGIGTDTFIPGIKVMINLPVLIYLTLLSIGILTLIFLPLDNSILLINSYSNLNLKLSLL